MTVFQGGDTDTLTGGNRSDGVHFTAAGAENVSFLDDAAMHASGAPFEAMVGAWHRTVLIALCMVCAAAIHIAVERPAIMWRHRIRYSKGS